MELNLLREQCAQARTNKVLGQRGGWTVSKVAMFCFETAFKLVAFYCAFASLVFLGLPSLHILDLSIPRIQALEEP